MIRLRNDTTINGFRHGAGSVLSIDPPTEMALKATADAESLELAAVHPYYHFHGYAGNQCPDDSQFLDLSGASNHASRGANLSISQLWTTNLGYASTIDPVTGYTDSVLRIPNMNFDYTGGQKLILWWLGKVTPEASTQRFIGDGYGNNPGQYGWRVGLSATGMVNAVLSGAGADYYSTTATTSISGGLHSFAFAFDGQSRKYGMWIDEVFSFGGGVYPLFNNGVSVDTRNSNTVNLGTSQPAASGSTGGVTSATRAFVILRLPATYPMPPLATLTTVLQQLRVNPGKLIMANEL